MFDTAFERASEWADSGSVVVPRLFDWWFEPHVIRLPNGEAPKKFIAEWVEYEFDMYDFHQRLIGGRANLGWLRTMYYSLGQQLMRQDPLTTSSTCT